MTNKILAPIVMFSLLSLTACSQMNGQFDCPLGKGVSCQSMKQVDRMANQGYFNESENGKQSMKMAPFKIQNTFAYQAPFRVQEKIIKIWFAPFVDSQDNFHKDSEVFTIIENSFWQGNPVHSIEGAVA